MTLKATSMDGGEASYEMEFIIIPKVESIEIYDARDMKKPVTNKIIGVNIETDKKTFTLRVKNKPASIFIVCHICYLWICRFP